MSPGADVPVGEILYAYAVVSSGVPGQFHAVRLRGVMAESVEHLVPGKDRVTQRSFALARCMRTMQIDCIKRKFG